MERITLTDGRIVHASKDYGPASALLTYPGEQAGLGTDKGVLVCKTPYNIDLVGAAGERVFGCEVKRPTDLIDSWFNRRLHRQLRTLRDVVDIPVLVLRGGLDLRVLMDHFWERNGHQAPSRRRGFNMFIEDLVNIQSQGVYLLPVPTDGYLPEIAALRRALGTNGARAVSGTDQIVRERKPGWLLRRIPGIGPAKSAELLETYGSVMGVFRAALSGGIPGAISGKIVFSLEESDGR